MLNALKQRFTGATEALVALASLVEVLLAPGVGADLDALLPDKEAAKRFVYNTLGLPAEAFGFGADQVGVQALLMGLAEASASADEPLADVLRRGSALVQQILYGHVEAGGWQSQLLDFSADLSAQLAAFAPAEPTQSDTWPQSDTRAPPLAPRDHPRAPTGGRGDVDSAGGGGSVDSETGSRTPEPVVHVASHESMMDEFDAKYDLAGGRELGRGACGQVCTVRHRETNALFAMKTVSVAELGSWEGLRNEVSMQKQLDHPNICKVFEAFEDFRHGEVHIIMELCTGGSLVSRMRSTRYSEEQAASFVQQMLSATLHCHRHGVVHRDIKLDHLLFGDMTDDAELKLIDFGFARAVAPGKDALHDQLGTPSYMAPELWTERSTPSPIRRETPHDSSVDMWAIGVVTYMLLSGQRPFHSQDLDEKVRMIKHEPLQFPEHAWAHISPEATEFVTALLSKVAEERPSAAEAARHPWLLQHTVAAAAHATRGQQQHTPKSLESTQDEAHALQNAEAHVLVLAVGAAAETSTAAPAPPVRVACGLRRRFRSAAEALAALGSLISALAAPEMARVDELLANKSEARKFAQATLAKPAEAHGFSSEHAGIQTMIMGIAEASAVASDEGIAALLRRGAAAVQQVLYARVKPGLWQQPLQQLRGEVTSALESLPPTTPPMPPTPPAPPTPPMQPTPTGGAHVALEELERIANRRHQPVTHQSVTHQPGAVTPVAAATRTAALTPATSVGMPRLRPQSPLIPPMPGRQQMPGNGAPLMPGKGGLALAFELVPKRELEATRERAEEAVKQVVLEQGQRQANGRVAPPAPRPSGAWRVEPSRPLLGMPRGLAEARSLLPWFFSARRQPSTRSPEPRARAARPSSPEAYRAPVVPFLDLRGL